MEEHRASKTRLASRRSAAHQCILLICAPTPSLDAPEQPPMPLRVGGGRGHCSPPPALRASTRQLEPGACFEAVFIALMVASECLSGASIHL